MPDWPAFPRGWLPVDEGPEHLVCYEPGPDAAGTRWIDAVYQWRDTVLRLVRTLAGAP